MVVEEEETGEKEVLIVAPEPPTTVVVVKPSRVRAALASILSWNMLVNFVLLWILGSLAAQVARLRAEVAFVADETRDLRLYGFDRADERWRARRDERRDDGWQGEEERWRQDQGRVRNWADSAVSDPPPPQPAADAQAAHTSAAHTRDVADPADAETVEDLLKPGAEEELDRKAEHAVAPQGQYGLGRVVHPGDWGTWIAHHPR